AFQMTSAVNTSAKNALAGLNQPEVGDQIANALGAVSKAALAASQAAQAARAAKAGQPPISCSGNDELSFTDQSLLLSAGVPITASGNCTVRLTRCTVHGTTAITLK